MPEPPGISDPRSSCSPSAVVARATTPGGRAACQMHDDDFARLNLTHREGLKRHVAAAAKGTLARRLEAAGASQAVCERYVKRVQT